jgi:hypothetical protein
MIPLSVVSGMERSGFPETTMYVSGMERSGFPETTMYVSGMERSGFPETTTMFREWSGADFLP